MSLTPARSYALGALIAIASALHKLVNAAVPVNDDFMHLTYSRQLLAGEWPVRDLFDYGMGMMTLVSALGQIVFGYRLLAEAIVVAVAAGASTFLVYAVARRATGSSVMGSVAALLLLVAAPRAYAYPKFVVYAVAAWLWWRYVWNPSPGRAIGLGVLAGAAFWWRPDHGAYVAVGVVCAMVATHGATVATLTRALQAGAVAVALTAPLVLFSSVQMGGLAAYAQSGIVAAWQEHRSTGMILPTWPLSSVGDLVGMDGVETYVPEIGIRWSASSSLESRRRVLDRYELTVVSSRDDVSHRVRLSRRSIQDLRALVAEAAVEDTDGVDRSRGRLPAFTWPALDRWRFNQWWLRIRLFPTLDEQGSAGEAAAVLLFVLPIMALGTLMPWLGRYLPPTVTPFSLACFAVFTCVVDVGLLRTPFHVRAGEAVVLPAIVLAVLTATLLNMARQSPAWRRWPLRAVVAVLLLLVVKSVAVAGQSGERVRWLAGDWESRERAGIAQADALDRLLSSPPIAYWLAREAGVTVRFATYARDCFLESDRILALWFAPEIYYYADRLMAGRHLFYISGFGALPHERRLEMDKIRRAPPQVAFMKVNADRPVSEAVPELLEYLSHHYLVAGEVPDGDELYRVLVRKDRTPARQYGDVEWPCYR